MTEAPVYGNFIEPGGKFSLGIESFSSEISPDKYFLGNVLGMSSIRDKAKDEIQYLGIEFFIQFSKGLPVSFFYL